jgi:hypothetical protein
MARHDIVCYHTMVGSLAGTSAMFHQNGYGGTESHFGVGGDGTVRQWQDTDFVAEANLNGNYRLISIETADYGEPMFGKWNTSGDNVPPWTDAQMRAIAEITARCCQAYNIPIELIPDSRPNRRGVGYHRQGCDPVRVSGGELWSSARGKVCPGARRIAQIPRVIEMARQLAGGGALSPSTPPPMKEPDPVQNFQIAPGAGALRLIVPVNAAGSGVARAWVSAVVNGPTKGDRVPRRHVHPVLARGAVRLHPGQRPVRLPRGRGRVRRDRVQVGERSVRARHRPLLLPLP